MTNILCEECLLDLFGDLEYTYFLTIKPKKDKVHKIHEVLMYLDSRVAYYWIVKCKSPSGFEHFHGIIRLFVGAKLKLAIHRKINRAMGHLLPFERVRSVKAVRDYINQGNNDASSQWLKVQTDGWGRELIEDDEEHMHSLDDIRLY